MNTVPVPDKKETPVVQQSFNSITSLSTSGTPPPPPPAARPEAATTAPPPQPTPSAGGGGGCEITNSYGGGVSGFVLKLFSMINGADDDIVSWTPSGDAFIIGSDIQRLEGETLPKFFRHNRFQSLVRQLNFYSFRKINRERNVWIYKHDLFHRDRPRDLHKVRRRTCPGVDGRKQRFSRPPSATQRAIGSDAGGVDIDHRSGTTTTPVGSTNFGISSMNVDHFTGTGDLKPVEETHLADSTSAHYHHRHYQQSQRKDPTVSDDDGSDHGIGSFVAEDSSFVPTTDIAMLGRMEGTPMYEEGRLGLADNGGSTIIDTSNRIVASRNNFDSFLFGSDDDDDDDNDDGKDPDDSASNNRKKRKMEMSQQSLVVSEVAVKLEEYVKKAMKERGITSKSRRGASGIVTPPFGATHHKFTISSSDLITYDDEYYYDECDSTNRTGETGTSGGLNGRLSSTDAAAANPALSVAHDDDDGATSPLVATTQEDIKRITREILQHSSVGNEDVVHACANVAAFFLCTHPNESPEECCEKVLHLLSTSPRLQNDFYSYQMALHPDLSSTLDDKLKSQQGLSANHAVYLRKSLLGGTAGRMASLRDFKVFAVNLIYKLLGVNGSLGVEDAFQPNDRAILLRTTEVWSRSVGVGA